MKKLFIIVMLIVGIAFLLMPFLGFGQATNPPVLCILKTSTNRLVWVSGGESNKQYWVQEAYPASLTTTNWIFGDWRRFYSSDFVTNTAVPVFDVNAPSNAAASKAMRFFKLGGTET